MAPATPPTWPIGPPSDMTIQSLHIHAHMNEHTYASTHMHIHAARPVHSTSTRPLGRWTSFQMTMGSLHLHDLDEHTQYKQRQYVQTNTPYVLPLFHMFVSSSIWAVPLVHLHLTLGAASQPTPDKYDIGGFGDKQGRGQSFSFHDGDLPVFREADWTPMELTPTFLTWETLWLHSLPLAVELTQHHDIQHISRQNHEEQASPHFLTAL